MKAQFFFLLFLLTIAGGRAQTPAKRDSLLQIARSAAADTARVLAWMETGKLYSNTLPDSALPYFAQGITLAERIGFERGAAKCRINRSAALNNLGRYREAIADCQAAAVICERLGMKKERVAAYNNLGNAWDFLGNRWQAIEAFSKALRAMEGIALPPVFRFTVRNNIARQYNDVRLFDRGFDMARQSYEEATALGDSVEIAFSMQVMAFAAISLNREPEALGYCRRIEAIARDNDLPLLRVFALTNIAVLTWEEKPAEARRLLLEALAVSREAGDKFGETGALNALARWAIYQKDNRLSQEYARQALQAARSVHLDDEAAEAYLTLSDLALLEGDIPLYRTYRQESQDMRDTLANNALIHAIRDLEARYESEKKAQQISQLEQESELQRLRLRQKNSLIWGLAALAILIATLAALAIRNLRNRRRLAEQTLQLQEQQLIQLKQEQQLTVADAVLRGQENERQRLARDLHDGLGGMLSGVKQTLNGMKGNQILSETAALGLSQVIGDLDRSIGELRHIARNMMPEALVRFGLRDALQDYCDHVQLTSRLTVNFQAFGFDGERLPQQTEVILFRIAQELLNNIVKHAGADTVLVQLLRDETRVHLTVEDNGRGFDPEQLEKAPGVGWLNIRSRVNYLQGSLDLRTAPGEGTSVSIECPVV